MADLDHSLDDPDEATIAAFRQAKTDVETQRRAEPRQFDWADNADVEALAKTIWDERKRQFPGATGTKGPYGQDILMAKAIVAAGWRPPRPTRKPDPVVVPGYRQVATDDLASYIGEGVHTGLRKGSDAADAHALWKAISDSETEAWGNAVWFAAWCFESMGILVYEADRG